MNDIIGKLWMLLGIKNKDFNKGMDNADKKTGKLGGSFKKLGGMITAALSVAAIIAAGKALLNFTKKVVGLYDTQLKAETKVRQAVKSTGEAAGLSLRQLKREASDLQKNTMFGDETILNDVTAQLLTFTNIIGENFKRTQKVVLDLATHLDGDLKSASIQLGKALNDPVANLSALSKSGIQFSTEQKTMINGLVEQNKLFEAQSIILTELERQYGGQAEAMAKADLTMRKYKNMWSDYLETVGKEFAEAYIPRTTVLLKFLMPDVEEEKSPMEKFMEGFKEKTKGMQKEMYEEYVKDVEFYRKRMKDAVEKGLKEEVMHWGTHLDKAKNIVNGIELFWKSLEPPLVKIPSLYEKIAVSLKELKEQREAAITREEIAAINDKVKALEAEKKALDNLTQSDFIRSKMKLLTTRTDISGLVPPVSGELAGVSSVLSKNVEMSEYIQGMIDAETVTVNLADAILVLSMIGVDAFSDLMVGVGAGSVGLKKIFDRVNMQVADFGITFGKQMVAAGMLKALADKFLFVPGEQIVAAGLALIAVSSLYKGAISKGPFGSSGGGGGAAISYATANRYKPLSYAGDKSSNVVKFVIEQDQLVGVLKSYNNRKNNF